MKNNKYRHTIRINYIFGIILALMTALSPISAESGRITQIDTSRLAATQNVRLFVNFDIPAGHAFNPDLITVQESSDGTTYHNVRITDISRQATRNEGISFLLLLDNSGSMWDDLAGNPTENPEVMRITHAKRAIREFVANLSPLDRAGLATFNTNYSDIHPVSADTSSLSADLDQITRPERDDGYTELYGSIVTALNTFGQKGRRKALIILSDGEHFPFAGKSSMATADDGIEAAIRAGITPYVVNFGTTRDSEAPRIALESGGLVFDAENDTELLGIYSSIREQILNEYAITYTASMIPGEKRYVTVAYGDVSQENTSDATRYYYSGTILGGTTRPPRWFFVLFLIIPALLWVLLLLFKLEKPTTEAGLQLLYGATGMQTKIFNLKNDLTVIGGSNAADITIAGNPAMKESAATIALDKKRGTYTIAADSDMTVNNKPVKTKKLEPGDVVNIAGTVVVYNDPSENETQ